MRSERIADQEKRNFLFAQALVHQKKGRDALAARSAKSCLRFCKLEDSLEYYAAGQIIVIEGVSVCLPDLLHEETARYRFAAAGIQV